MATQQKELGKRGELHVCRYLEQENFTIKTVNYTRKSGEIDIIAQRSNLLVFVEVKLRSYLYFAVSQIITPAKQKKIIQTACHYRHEQGLENMILRFDVALLTYKDVDYELTYIPDAFRPGERFFV
jgi:putative endonuclease